MNREEIIQVAIDAGFQTLRITEDTWYPYLDRFFHKAQALEREACAKVCEDISKKSVSAGWGYGSLADDCAAAIRARK